MYLTDFRSAIGHLFNLGRYQKQREEIREIRTESTFVARQWRDSNITKREK